MRKLRRVLALVVVLTLLTPIGTGRASVIAWGSRGQLVTMVQQALKQWGYLDGAVDGVFGRETYEAVVLFQQRNGLTVDGKVGSATAAALGLDLSGTALTATIYRETELTLLARLVSGEARGEPYIGQVAVAAVVLNRVKNAAFPNTISGVIFQAGAFDAVWDGQFDMEPSDSCYRAARDAMNGWDPTGGCVFYYNPRTATNAWILSRTVQLTIGQHAFCV